MHITPLFEHLFISPDLLHHMLIIFLIGFINKVVDIDFLNACIILVFPNKFLILIGINVDVPMLNLFNKTR